MNENELPTNDIDEVEFHPVAELFPLLVGNAFDGLVADIRRQGLLEPIWRWKGKVIDGRNRLLACRRAGVEPRFQEYEGSDPVGFAVSKNMHRRHLSKSQRALIAANLANLRQGVRTDLEPSADMRKVSQSDAADMLHVSERSVTNAARVMKHGTQELVDAVGRDEVPITTAAEATKLPASEQKRAVWGGKQMVRDAVKQQRKPATETSSKFDPNDLRWYHNQLHLFEGLPTRETPREFLELHRRRTDPEMRIKHLAAFVPWMVELGWLAAEAGLLDGKTAKTMKTLARVVGLQVDADSVGQVRDHHASTTPVQHDGVHAPADVMTPPEAALGYAEAGRC